MSFHHIHQILDAPALFFDLDGVIADSAPLHMRAYEQAFAEAGLYFSDTARSMVRCGAARSRVLAQALKDPSHPLFADIYNAKEQHFRAFVEAQALHPIAGAPDFVRGMKAQGKKLALVTSSRAPSLTLTPLGLEGCFDVVIGAGEIESPKPHPAGYQLAIAKLAVAAGDCVAFEDSVEGVAAATAAGLGVVGVGDRVRDEVSIRIDDFLDPKLPHASSG